MPDVTHEAFYDHPGCGCREHDEKPHAHCVTCEGGFTPEVDYGEPYRFCPLCGVEFTLCRWTQCVDRMWQPGSAVADWKRKRQTGWRMDSRCTMFNLGAEWKFDRCWDEVSEWGMDDRDRVLRFLRTGTENGHPSRSHREGRYLRFSDDWGEYRFYFTAPRRKLPG
jgi:hypothetical protein